MEEAKKPKDFDSPTATPKSDSQAREWQKSNYKWWQSAPMRYDWKESIPYKEFSRGFYKEIDERFFESSKGFLPEDESIPFDSIINFDYLKDKRVLEIGIGNGSHAQLLAKHAKSFTGIDLTDYSIKSTKKRFQIFNLEGVIKKEDAENMEFPDNYFDFVWSWGVIHHSANPENILKEIKRVLKPEGKAVIMIYYRGWWNYYLREFIWGVLSGNLFKFKTLSIHKVAQMHSDGAIARFYTIKEWKKLINDNFNIKKSFIGGLKSDVVPLPDSALKRFLIRIIPRVSMRFCNRKFKMGSFLISELIQK